MAAAGLDHLVHRRHHLVRHGEGRPQPQRQGEIHRPHEQAVHPGGGGDGVQVFQRLGGLDHHHAERLLRRRSACGVVVSHRPERADAARRIADRLGGQARLLRRGHHGDDDAERAKVHGPHDLGGIAPADANKGAGAPKVERLDGGKQVVPGHRAVLGVEDHPVEAGLAHDLHRHGVGHGDPAPEGGPPRGHRFAHLVQAFLLAGQPSPPRLPRGLTE